MPIIAEHQEFAPPQPPGLLRALGLALLAHVLLLIALTWGVHWRQQPVADAVVEAEIWSSVPQQAAPRPVEPPPPPPEPTPQAQPKVEPDTREADIALARKKREDERKAQQKKEAELAQRAAEEKEKLARQKKAEEDKRLAQQREEERRKDTAKAKEEARKEAARAAKEAEARRQAAIKRALAMAGNSIGTGSETGTGTAARSAGPSAGYGLRIAARIKANIVFGEAISGNPMAEVAMRVAPDGTIISRRIVKSSGIKDWDEAVLRAIDKTEVLPKDTDGRVPSEMNVFFRPKD